MFSSTGCLNRHIKKVHEKIHEKSKTHKCKFCEDTYFFALYELQRHNEYVHSKDLHDAEILRKKDKLISQNSGGVSNEILTPQEQSLIQISIKNFTDGKCEYCEETFEDPEELFSHLTYHYNEGHVFKCCNFKSQDAEKVINHIRKTHYKNHKCVHCNEAFFTDNELILHDLLSNHKNECRICNNKFSTTRDLNDHTKYFHEIGEDYKCDLCDSLFTRFIDLKMHKDSVHKRRKKCNFCSKSFINNSSLNRHIKALHMLKQKSYECLFCDKKFSQSQDLKRHKQVHENRYESYKCDQCDKTYQRDDTLKRHVKTVHKKIPNQEKYKCKMCNKVFLGRLDSLKRHVKLVH